MIINHNLNSMNAHRNMSFNTTQTGKAMEKLSSGLRINRAGDDAAGLAISEKMRGQIRGLDQATRNSQDGISLIQTAEGALNETHSILQRMRELATQAANDTNTSSDRGEIQKEINSLTSEINRVGNTTEFNTQKLLNGEKTSSTAAQAASMTVDLGSSKTLTISDASAGADANGIQIEFTTAGGDALGVTQSGNKITIALANTTATNNSAAAIQTAIQNLGTVNGVDVSDWTITANAAYTAAPEIAASIAPASMAGGSEVGAGLQFQIGANESQSLTLEISDMRASALGLTGSGAGFTTATDVTNGTNNTGSESGLDVSTSANAASAVTVIQNAIDSVSAERSKLGANQNRLEHTINNLSTSAENLQAAESRIRDVDMAKEMMNFTKNNILNQAAQAMMAQSNQQPQAVLQLLR